MISQKFNISFFFLCQNNKSNFNNQFKIRKVLQDTIDTFVNIS